MNREVRIMVLEELNCYECILTAMIQKTNRCSKKGPAECLHRNRRMRQPAAAPVPVEFVLMH